VIGIKQIKFLKDDGQDSYISHRRILSVANFIFSSVRGMNKFHAFLISTCMYALFIFYLSSLSSPPCPSDVGFLRGVLRELIKLFEEIGVEFLVYPLYLPYRYPDKFAHLILYMVFGLLLHFTLKNARNPVMTRYAAVLAVIFGTIYGITDEIHQAFVPFRTPSYADLIADIVGLALAQALVFMYARFRSMLGASL